MSLVEMFSSTILKIDNEKSSFGGCKDWMQCPTVRYNHVSVAMPKERQRTMQVYMEVFASNNKRAYWACPTSTQLISVIWLEERQENKEEEAFGISFDFSSHF